MKRRLLLALIFAFFVVNGAIAGSGSLVGDWKGEARAILPNGMIIEGIDLEGTLDELDGGLFSGEFTFTLPAEPGEIPETVTAFATGYIKAQKLQGIMSYEAAEDVFQGVGFFNGKLKGKKMVGVVRDLSDGSTTYFTAERSN
jgi:hypothetical protein